MSARFKAADVFGIKGRGLVVSGKIEEGAIQIGMAASIPGFPRKLGIHGVEFICRIGDLPCNLGLRFTDLSAAETALLKNLDLKDKIIEIADGAT